MNEICNNLENNKKEYEKILIKLANSNLNKNEIVSIYLYGSYKTNDNDEDSDIDTYFILKNANQKNLNAIAKIKNKFFQLTHKKVFINIIEFEELNNSLRDGTFIHRERSLLFLFEFLNENFKLIYGKPIHKELSIFLPDYKELDKELIKLIRHFKYMTCKILANYSFNTSKEQEIQLLKYLLFSSKIFKIFYKKEFTNFFDSVKFSVDFLKDDLLLEVYSKRKNFNLLEKKEKIINFYKKILNLMRQIFLERYKIKEGCFIYKGIKAYFYYKLENNKKAIIFLGGLPRPSKIENAIEFLTSEGFIFINVFYPGYWEGEDILDFRTLPDQLDHFVNFVKGGKFFNEFAKELIKFTIKEIIVVGSSFGATLALNLKEGDKIIAISPLINFKRKEKIINDLFDKLKFFKQSIRINNLNDFNLLDPKPKFYFKDILFIYDLKDKIIDKKEIEKFMQERKIEKRVIFNEGIHGYRLFNKQFVLNKILYFINEGASKI